MTEIDEARANDDGTRDVPAQRKPLFQTEDLESIDETWRNGAYIGGLASAGRTEAMARSYLLAGTALVQQAIRDDAAWEIVLPALFLFRHAIELRLKSLVQPATLDHDLDKLVGALDETLTTQRGFGLPARLVGYVAELNAMDSRADAFRFYDRKPTKQGAGGPFFPDEVWVDLAHLLFVVDWIDRELRALA